MIEDIVNDFLSKNPAPMAERTPKKSWKETNPEKYEAAKVLKAKGYSVKQITKYFGISYETIRKQFERDGIVGPRHRYRKYQMAKEQAGMK